MATSETFCCDREKSAFLQVCEERAYGHMRILSSKSVNKRPESHSHPGGELVSRVSGEKAPV